MAISVVPPPMSMIIWPEASLIGSFAPIAAALREMNYEGYVSAEVLPWPDAEAAAAQTMAAFREHFPRPVS